MDYPFLPLEYGVGIRGRPHLPYVGKVPAQAAFPGAPCFQRGGGFAQAVATGIVPFLEDADTVSIVGVSNTVTLLLPPLLRGTSGLLTMVNGVLLKPVPQAAGKTPPYSPAMAAAVNLSDEQAGSLTLA